MDNERLLAEIAQCEQAVWDALVTGDVTADLAALDDAFLGYIPMAMRRGQTMPTSFRKGRRCAATT